MASKVSGSEKKKEYKYQGVYWNDTIPTVKAFLKYNVGDLKKGQVLDVQVEGAGFTLNLRAKCNLGLFIVNLYDLEFYEAAPILHIKENRKKLIARGMIKPLPNFDK